MRQHLRNAAAMAAAHLSRSLNTRTKFIAITGSSGKSTARHCLAAILRAAGFRVAVPGGNAAFHLAQGMLGVRRTDDLALVEVGISESGEMGRRAAMVRPHLAIITKVGLAHPLGLPTLEITAREKRKLLDSVIAGGAAVLNGEDPFVREMSAPQLGKVVRYGDVAGSIARAREVRSSLEEGLRFRLECPSGSRELRVRLYGVHWVSAVLAAVAAALELGVSLDAIGEGLETVYAHPVRMEPVVLPNGAIVIRDEYNGALPSFEAAMAFLAGIRGRRRFVVISEIRYLEDDAEARFGWLAGRIAEVAEGAVFVTPYAALACEKAIEAGIPEDLVHGFEDLREASERLPSILGPGDVALLRGRSIDHLSRMVFAQFGTVGCWMKECPIIRPCDTCSELRACDGSGEPTRLAHLAG